MSGVTTQARTASVARAWQIDPAHTSVEFAVRHLMISTVKGRFGEISGSVLVDEADPTHPRIDVSIPVASIDTRQEQRDNHLRSPDFFDAERFPTIRFVGRRVEGDSRKSFRLIGDLTIKGVSREIGLDGTLGGRSKDPWGNERVGYNAVGSINRADFGLTWNQLLEAGGVAVGDEVRISVDLELTRPFEEADVTA